MRKKSLIAILILLTFVFALALSGCDGKLKTEEEKDVEKWFKENKQSFESVKDQILLFETDFKSFSFYIYDNEIVILDRKLEILDIAFGEVLGKESLAKGQLYDVLEAFFAATHYAQNDVVTIKVTWEDGVCRIDFNFLITEIEDQGLVIQGHGIEINYAKKNLDSNWIKLKKDWFYWLFGVETIID